MQNLINRETDFWERPWNKVKFDDLADRDERFFALVIKGALSWLNANLLMYNKPIKHFIFNTGSSYLYIENNGYEYTWCETTGEDLMYMETPRCLVKVGAFTIPLEELTAPYVRGEYERVSTAKDTKGQIIAYNAEMQRLPIEFNLHLSYVFSTFNEAIIFTQELFETVLFQQYFDIIYLGQIIKCSIEANADTTIEFQDIDMASQDVNQRTMSFDIKITTNLPIINTQTESRSSNIIMGTVGILKTSGVIGDTSTQARGQGELNEEVLEANNITTKKELNENNVNPTKYI